MPISQFEKIWYAADDKKGKHGIAFVIKNFDKDNTNNEAKLKNTAELYLGNQQLRLLIKKPHFLVSPVPGEF